MANKLKLRESYTSLGWKVEPVETWRLVSKVEDLLKFDVNVASPEGQIGTAQVLVRNNETAEEEASAEGFWKASIIPFAQQLRIWLDSIEATPTIFAIQVDSATDSDKTALVSVFFEVDNAGTTKAQKKNYVVKYRNDTFSFLELT